MDDHSDRVRRLALHRQALLFLLQQPSRRLLRVLQAPDRAVDDAARRVFQKLAEHRLHPAPRPHPIDAKSKAEELRAKERLLREELGIIEEPAPRRSLAPAAPPEPRPEGAELARHADAEAREVDPPHEDVDRKPGHDEARRKWIIANAPIFAAAAALALLLVYKYLL